MKKIILIFILLFTLTSCSSEESKISTTLSGIYKSSSDREKVCNKYMSEENIYACINVEVNKDYSISIKDISLYDEKDTYNQYKVEYTIKGPEYNETRIVFWEISKIDGQDKITKFQL